ncbi:unnamed protein product [Psylliodes chrysocephalus]|uniref:MICOS complex subunit MIC60 n=1 Tax=Psylliodes chrysocephalus TaxID=3402493 RepID=A0A9P0D520_9CUCU|nr:unnamed protein product [Psylliodes chrysocephala]
MLRIARGVQNKKIWKQHTLPVLTVPRPLSYNNCYTIISSRQYSQSSDSQSGGSGGRKLLLAVGALVAAGGATLAYAKHDNDFRKTLTGVAPFTDDFISVLWQEKSTGNNVLVTSYQNVKGFVTGFTNKDDTPHPVKQTSAPPQYKGANSKPKQEKKSFGDAGEYSAENITKLEQKICQSAEEAVNAFNKAVYITKLYNADIEYIVDEAVNEIKSETWEQIKSKTRSKIECVKRAVEKADIATKDINKLKFLISSRNFDVPESSKQIIRDNIIKVQEDIENARKELEREQKTGKVSEKYWDKIEKARHHFSEELESLFPTVDLAKQELNVNKEDLDLFVLHAYANVLFYQKELAKMETIINEKMRLAIEAAKQGGFEELTDAQIREALEQEKRRIALTFQHQVLKLRKEHELELRDALKRQSQTFTDHLEDEVKKREEEIQRCLSRKFDEVLENERSKAKVQMAAVVGRLKGIDEALQEKHRSEEAAKQGQVLWSACQSLLGALTIGCPGLTWKDQIRPLDPEIRAVEKAAVEKDDLVSAVVNGIPKEARDRGVYPEDALRERFLKVEKVARTVALIPAEGASLPIHLLSFLQSLLLIRAASPIPQAELNDEKVDVSKLNTIEILQRARYWLDRGDFAQSLKYMNLLTGAPRCVAREWMNETRIYLETRQAANTLMAYATSSGLSCL